MAGELNKPEGEKTGEKAGGEKTGEKIVGMEVKKTAEDKTVLGIGEKIEGTLCYLLWFVTGIIFLLVEKDNKFVRFHAIQSIATFLPLYILIQVIGSVIALTAVAAGLAGVLLTAGISFILWLVTAVLWVVLMYKTYRGEKYKLPIAGRIAERYS